MLNFDFLEKGLWIVSPLHFAFDFSKKYLSFYILLIDQILLSDCLYSLRYWAIYVLQLLVSQVVTSEILKLINLIFLIKPFFYIIKKPRQKLKYLDNAESF